MKRVLCSVIFSFFILAASVFAADLTPRQLILLQIPSKFALNFNEISWSVIQTPTGPVEEVAVTVDEGKLSIYTLGENLKAVAIFKPLPDGSDYETVFKAKIADGKLTTLDEKSKKKFSEERLATLVDDLSKTVNDILSHFGIKSDDDLGILVAFLTQSGISPNTAL